MLRQMSDVTILLKRMQRGDKTAVEKLLPLVLGEMKRLARNYMKSERVGHTLQPTALVNEAYLRLAGYQRMDWQSRSHFIGVAASVMRQLLIDYSRKRLAQKRGGEYEVVPLEEGRMLLTRAQSEELLELDEALKELSAKNPRHAKIVELRHFGGLSVEETAEALGISPVTVKRDWALARAWLRARLEGKLSGD
jgi:RNA polymerase sigma factor (TIGR02999 family)